MVDLEVENTLREIRERVRAEAQAQTGATAQSIASRPHAGEDSAATQARGDEATSHASAAHEMLARLEANLATTERAWNRLPPLMSNRSGLVARLELWVKRQIKRATHWYTWEQVNFNASVYHALRDTLSVLRSYDKHLAQQYFLLRAELESQKAEVVAAERARADAERERADAAHTRLEAERLRLEARHAQFDEAHSKLQARLDALEIQLRAVEQGWRNEQHERIEHVLEEQRVCFRQLSLEAGETAVMYDRARRDIEAHLADLARSIEEMKAGKQQERG